MSWPRGIETDFGGGAVRDNKQLNAMIASQTALGRVGLPDDIGGAIASLLEAENAWISAQRIEISGGRCSICTGAGSALGLLRPIAILSGILPLESEPVRSSQISGLPPKILFRQPQTTRC
jgi:hypothetical protein